MTAAAPEAPAGGGGMSRRVGGMPLWLLIVAGLGGLGVGWYLIHRSSSSSTTAGSQSSTPAAGDEDTSGQAEYEQISAELVGLEGTQQALLAAVKDLQGKTTGGEARVPDVTGDGLSAAEVKIRGAGFRVDRVSGRVPAGEHATVTGTTPPGGTRAERGSTVRVRYHADRNRGGPVRRRNAKASAASSASGHTPGSPKRGGSGGPAHKRAAAAAGSAARRTGSAAKSAAGKSTSRGRK